MFLCSAPLSLAEPTAKEVVDIYNDAISSIIEGGQTTTTNAEACAASSQTMIPESYEQTLEPAQARAKVNMCCESYDKTGHPKNYRTCKDVGSRDRNPCIQKACAECAKCNPRLYCDFRTHRPTIDVYCTKDKPIGP